MILSAVMDDIGAALEPIPGLRVYPWPSDAPQVPAAIVQYPQVIEFNEAFQRGTDLMTTGVLVVAGRISDRTARDLLSVYCDGDSTTSVMGAIYTHTFTACSFCHVTEVTFEPYAFNGVDYIAAQFTLEIGGPGAAQGA